MVPVPGTEQNTNEGISPWCLAMASGYGVWNLICSDMYRGKAVFDFAERTLQTLIITWTATIGKLKNVLNRVTRSPDHQQPWHRVTIRSYISQRVLPPLTFLSTYEYIITCGRATGVHTYRHRSYRPSQHPEVNRFFFLQKS